MNCPSCGQAVPDGSRFCPNCGQLLVHTEERRIVTVLFADLVGFTGLAEDRDPEQLKHLIDRCFQRLVADITSFGGTVDKIIGDAIVALFGAPTAHEDDAERAVRAALRMQRTLDVFSQEQGGELRMRIGVNTGEVLVGALRAGGDYTAMGDTVNIASRLQSLAHPGEVLVGVATHAATKAAISYESRGDIDLRGRDDPVAAFVAMKEMAPPGRRRESTRAPLVGRSIEQLHLTSAVDTSVARSRAHLVNILGEAGMGKTRLAEEVAAAAEATHDALVLEGRVLPYGEINPLRSIGEAIGNAAGVATADSIDVAAVKVRAFVDDTLGFDATEADVDAVTEAFLRVMGRPTSLDAMDPTRRRNEVLEGIKAFFLAATKVRPTVLVMGDIQWADERLLKTFEYLLQALAGRPFVLLATARWTVDEQRWVVPPGRHNTIVLNLDPLDRVAASRLITALAGMDVPDAVAEQLYDRSGGNPFFLEEIATLLREAGVVGPGGRLDEEERSIGELPDNLRGLVAARLDSLSPDERTMVENASVLGRRGPVYGLQLMGGDDEAGQSTLRRLVDKDILTTESEWWRFRSDLVRDVAYSMLTRSARAVKHLMVAEWMTANFEDVTSERVGVIADHYGSAAELAGDVGNDRLPADLADRAVDWLGRAGEAADERDSHYVAAQRFHRAIELLPDEDPRLVELLLGRARARLGLRELSGAASDAQWARDLATAADLEHGLAIAVRTLGEIHSAASENTQAATLLDEAVERFRVLGDVREGAEALRLRGMVALFDGDAALADRYIDQAHSVFVELDDTVGVAWCLQNLAWISFEQGLVDEAEARLQRAVDLFTELEDLSGLSFARGLMAFLRFHEGRKAEAEELAGQVRELAHERGERFGEAMMDLLLASIQLWSGRARSAVQRATEAQAVFEQIESDFGVVQALGLLGRAHAAVGQLNASSTALAECLRRALAMPGRPLEPFARLVSAGGAVQTGDPQAALDQITEVGTHFEDQRVIGSVDLEVTRGLALLQLGRVEEALQRLSEVPEMDGVPSTYLHSTLALALAAAGRPGEVIAHVDDVFADSRATYLDTRTAHVAAALAEVRRGDVEAADRWFADAIATVDASESRMSQAVVRLARAIGHEALGTPAAVELRVDAERALEDLGVHPTGWDTAFRLAAGFSGSVPEAAGSR